jgi:hypothetical protein
MSRPTDTGFNANLRCHVLVHSHPKSQTTTNVSHSNGLSIPHRVNSTMSVLDCYTLALGKYRGPGVSIVLCSIVLSIYERSTKIACWDISALVRLLPGLPPPPVEQAIVSYDSESERDDSSLSTESSSIWSWLSSLLPTSTAHLVQQQVEHRTKRQCCRADLLPCPIIDSPDGLVQQDGCFHYPEDRSVCLTRRATERQDRVAQFLLQTRTKQQRYRAALLPCPIKARTCPRKARTNHCSVLETLPGGRAAPRASNTLDGGDPSNSSFTSSRISSISSSSSLGSSSSSLPKIREDKDASSDISVHTGDSTISTYNEFLRDSKSTYNDILPREDQSSSGAPELQQFVPPLTAPKQTNKVQEERPCAWKPTCLCQAK